MILPGNASLILSTVRQIIKLSGRIDALLAQKTAVQAQLVLGMPQVRLGNAQAQKNLARRHLTETAQHDPDPFASDRAAFGDAIDQNLPAFDTLFAKYFPDEVSKLTFSPDDAYLAQLEQAFPTLQWKNLEVRMAAFALAAGPDNRQINYTTRVALAVADTLLEFGAENTALFVRDEKLRAVMQSVLQRFASPEWDQFESWNPLLQTALKAALNSALDVADQLQPDNPWLDGVLDALVKARTAAPQPDEFLLGLMQGQGVPLLLSQGLLVASERLGKDQAQPFKLVAADMLAAAAPYMLDRTNPSLGQFFKDHWGDLLRAGLTSLDKHGDALLDPAQPLLNGVLKSVVQQLAKTPNHQFLSSDTVYRLADAAIGVVAANPGQLTGLENKPWLRDFIVAAADTAQRLTAKKLFTREAADALLRDALSVLAQHPGLVVGDEPVALTLASSVFDALAQLPRLDARSVGETAVRSSLQALAKNPGLVSTQFAPVVTAAATELAGWVGNGKITSAQAAGLASAVIDAIAKNPGLYAGAQAGVANGVLAAVQAVFPPQHEWAARLLVDTARETLLALGRTGEASGRPAAQLQQLITTVLTSGLQTAAAELGRSTDLEGIAPALGGLVAQAVRGDLTVLDPNSPEFVAAFRRFTAPAT